MITLAQRAVQLAPSETLAMAARASALRIAGHDVISFATGEPDFATPLNITTAVKAALDAGQTKYPPTGGIPELKEAICKKLTRDQQLTYAADNIVVTCGAKEAIALALQTLIDNGDEVIIPAPYWVSFPEQVKLCGGVPRIVAGDETNGFRITAQSFARAISPRTRVLILNSPCNPTGTAYTRDQLAALAEVAVTHGVTIISDEIYEKLVYDGFTHTSIASTSEKAKSATIVINGCSKAFAMTGWRLGYAAGPAKVIAKMAAIQSQQTSGPATFVQHAAVEALNGPQAAVRTMVEEFKVRRDVMLGLVMRLSGVSCHRPEGAFYLLPRMTTYLGKRAGTNVITTAAQLADYLLDAAHVAVVGGDAFGAPGAIRLSYATARARIEEGMQRIGAALAKLK